MVSIFREIFEMCASPSCVCTCRAMANCCACLGSCLWVKASSGSSLKETRWAISARVLSVNVHVFPMTTLMIMMSTLRVPWDSKACLRGS